MQQPGRGRSRGSGQCTAGRVAETAAGGALDIVCAVDMLNEGIDLDVLATILMLRPTESKILWLAQFGHGLRRGTEDKRLTVIDQIGDHRTFLLKPRTLFDLPAGDSAIQSLLERLDVSAKLPPGCEVSYDLEAVEIFRALLRTGRSPAAARRIYLKDFLDLHGVRASALETYRDGYNPRAVRQDLGFWFGFVESCDALEPAETAARDAAARFLEMLEVTQMTKSFRMIALLAALDEDQFPGSIPIADLVAAVRCYTTEHPKVGADFADAIQSNATLRPYLKRNPIRAWTGAAGTGGERCFRYENRIFASTFRMPAEHRAVFRELAREIAESRLAEFLDRPSVQGAGALHPQSEPRQQPADPVPARSRDKYQPARRRNADRGRRRAMLRQLRESGRQCRSKRRLER